MLEYTKSYVKYLNTLHNYNAQNQNAFGEKNISSPYYAKTRVEMDVCKRISSVLNDDKPHVLILTGHAGDGKTSLMYQVLSDFGVSPDTEIKETEVKLNNGKFCWCIKDFSDFNNSFEKGKLKMMREIVEYPTHGKSVFLVANTGPLINTFGELFDDPVEREQAKMELIEAMDSNINESVHIFDYSFFIINIAAIDNTFFPAKYLDKITDESLWGGCSACDKKSFCHIHMNQNLIRNNIDRVKDFIEKYYVWETEYGHRLTIRSMTEHLAYMLTGGISCEEVQPIEKHQMLFTNLFFGFRGILEDPRAKNIIAVKLAQENHFDSKRLRADELLLIRKQYNNLFANDVAEIIVDTEKTYMYLDGWAEERRRMLFFLNIVSDSELKNLTEDIFTKQFVMYMSIRKGITKPSRRQKELIMEALRMMYLGTVISNSSSIPITLSKESGIAQSVQLVIGELNNRDIEVIEKIDSSTNGQKYNLILRVKKKEELQLSLPLIDYFDELRSGVIDTNIDPQLSHGLESLKALLLKEAYTESDDLEMVVLNNRGYDRCSISIEDGQIRLD